MNGLFWFYGISTIIDYLILYLFYTHEQFYFKDLVLHKYSFLFTRS